jgi:hypothetical protein
MPDFSRYNVAANPFSAVANKLGQAAKNSTTTGQMVLKHGMDLEAASHQHGLNKDFETHKGNVATNTYAANANVDESRDAAGHKRQKEIMRLGHKLGETAADSAHSRTMAQNLQQQQFGMESGAAAHEQTLAVNDQANAHERALGAEKHTQALAAGDAEHARTLDLHKNLLKAAGHGTPVTFQRGDVNFNYTKQNAPVETSPAPKTEAPTSTPARGPVGIGMPTMPAPTAGPKPTVTRGAGGKMVSLKNGATPATAKKASKKAPATKGQPTVGRGPGGKMISLKNKP